MDWGGYMNPYQQNIEIIKGFFQRKIILFYAIVTIIPIFSLVFIDVNDLMNAVGGINGVSFLNNVPQNTNVAGTFASMYFMFIFEILLAVAFLLFFVKAGSEESSLKAPIGIFRVVSIISLVIVSLIALGMVYVVLFASLYLMVNSPAFAIFAVPCMFITIPLLIFQVFAQTLFAGNIKESANSIYLKKNGAKLYGIANIIVAVICVYVTVIITSFGMYNIVVFAPLIAFFGLSAVKYVFGAVVGIKYAKYIEGFSDSATTRENEAKPDKIDISPDIIICKKCGKPLTKDDYFCNHCGTPVEK